MMHLLVRQTIVPTAKVKIHGDTGKRWRPPVGEQRGHEPALPANNHARMTTRCPYTTVLLPEPCRAAIVEHCRRKLALELHRGELAERKAYGLLAGTVDGGIAEVVHVEPLRKNARGHGHFKRVMDAAMNAHAVASETPLDRRGWVADPRELFDALRAFQARGWQLIGTYHMHRVAWEHDPLRDTPTRLDHHLAAGSGLFVCIVSMVDPTHPRLRVFYEADPGQELSLRS